MKELNKVAILLRSVQESYPTLVTALLARKDEELKLIFVKQALMDEEQRKAKGNGSGDSAFKVKHHPKHRKSVVCFNCGITGHYQRDCCKPPKKKQPTQQNQNKHRAEKATEAVQSSESESEDAQMFIANDALRADIQEDEWIIDSRASKHMTFNRCVLRHYMEFETPEPVGLGDGSTVNALGMGEVKFTSHLPHNGKVTGWMSNVLFVPQLANNLFSVRAAA